MSQEIVYNFLNANKGKKFTAKEITIELNKLGFKVDQHQIQVNLKRMKCNIDLGHGVKGNPAKLYSV
jgi:hypothetical protein